METHTYVVTAETPIPRQGQTTYVSDYTVVKDTVDAKAQAVARAIAKQYERNYRDVTVFRAEQV